MAEYIEWRVIETSGTLEPKGAVIWQDGYGEIAHMVEIQKEYLANAQHIVDMHNKWEAFEAMESIRHISG